MFRLMRTTLNIDDEVVQAAKSIARARSVSLGKVVTELLRKGLEAESRPGNRHVDSGFPVFTVPSGARPITLDDVKSAEDEP